MLAPLLPPVPPLYISTTTHYALLRLLTSHHGAVPLISLSAPSPPCFPRRSSRRGSPNTWSWGVSHERPRVPRVPPACPKTGDQDQVGLGSLSPVVPFFGHCERLWSDFSVVPRRCKSGPTFSQRLMRTTELGTCDIETCGTTGELEALPPAREASGMRCSWVTLGGSRDDNLKCRPSSRGICIRRNLDVGWLWTAHPDSGQIIQIREWSQIRVACALHPSDLNPIQHCTTSYTY